MQSSHSLTTTTPTFHPTYHHNTFHVNNVQDSLVGSPSCPEHPIPYPAETLSDVRSAPLPGEAWRTKVSIHLPVLELVKSTVPDIQTEVPRFSDALQKAGRHVEYKARPCIALGRQKGRSFLSYACATFGGSKLEMVTALTRRFIVRIHTARHPVFHHTHIHSTPEWEVEPAKPAYVLSVPFISEFRPDSFVVMDGRDERPSWPETKLPRLEVFNERKFQFGPDALDEIQAQFIEARRQWEWELDPRDRQAAVKEIRDLCEEIFATTRTNREKKRHQVRIDKLGRHDGKRLRKHESVARDALAQQNVLARTATASIGKIDRGTGRRLSRTGSGGRMPRMYNFEKRYKGLLASQWS